MAFPAMELSKIFGLISSVLDWVGEGLLRHVDTVQEFSLVLFSDSADLIDLGAAEGEGSVVDTIEH